MLKINKKDQPTVKVFKGVTRKTLACGKDILLARFDYEKGAVVPLHKHAYEQLTTILKGCQKIIIKGNEMNEEIMVEAGDSYIVPAQFEHEQVSIEESVTIDAWNLAP